MRNISEINVQEIFVYVKNAFDKTTKKQRIFFAVGLVLLLVLVISCKNLWQNYSILRQAKKIVAKVTQVQKQFWERDNKYEENIFADLSLRNSLHLLSDDPNSPDDILGIRHRRSRFKKENDDYSIGYNDTFYIENDAENGCIVLKHEKGTNNQTTFYASFKNGKVLCQGKRCFKETKNNSADLCYKDGICFHKNLKEITERPCGNGNGVQKRKCLPSCENGTCEEWGKCECKKGFEWDGTTCKQSQTEEDCNVEQCFNGTYCEDKENLEKEIKHGSCNRLAVCQKKAGWQYTPWECSCDSEDFCSLNEECITRPKNEETITLPEEESSCTGINYECKVGQGWVQLAQNCNCEKIGTFWDEHKKEAKCSPCTKKPVGAVYTSAGGNKDACSWVCDDEHQARNGTCLKPNGQYLCAKTDLHICTDEFSKNRKIQKDAKKTNEGQPCYVEDKDNILYYNQKEKICQICQCIDLATEKISN